jgi:hypothetical protein
MSYFCRTGRTNWRDVTASRFHSVSSASDDDLLIDARETKKVMPGRYSLTVLCVVTIIGLLGCQSGPRWAWWKDSGTPPTDTSLVARTAVDSAGPASPGTDTAGVVAPDSSELASSPVVPNAAQETGLPSAQATPQTIAARAGPTQLSPAAVAQNSVAQNSVAQNSVAPNSVAPNSVAPNSVAPNSVAPNSVAPNSGPGVLPPGSAGTIAQAPIASYAPHVTPPQSVPSAPSTAPPSASSVASVGVPTSPAPKLTGPYDPARYQAPRSPQIAAGPGRSAPGRYPMPAGNDRYSTNTGPPTGLSDRYASPLASGTAPIALASQQTVQTEIPAAGSSLATVPTPRPTEPGQMNAGTSTSRIGDRYAALPPATGPAAVVQAGGPPAAAAMPQAVPQMSSVATVKATTSPGQYRPGGTSTYPSEQVELARRSAPTGSVGGPQAEGVTAPPTRYPGYTPPAQATAPPARTY